ncbi:MAG: cell wall hydrolase [Hyphomonadaceae bacterium]
MDELERSQDALKQGAVVVACLTAAAAGMGAVSHRGAEQRADAEWTARALAFQKSLGERPAAEANAPAARVELAAFSTRDGWRARAQAQLAAGALDHRAMIISASLRDTGAMAALRPFQPEMLQEAARVQREARCLSEAIYYEARGESVSGQRAVAEVVTNRVRSGIYPSTYCGVVYQGSERSTGCQFTFTCDGSLGRRPRGEAWDRSQMIAAEVMMGLSAPVTHRATHYHTMEVAPVWRASLVETTRIGAHVFYRFPTKKERKAAPADTVAAVLDTTPAA